MVQIQTKRNASTLGLPNSKYLTRTSVAHPWISKSCEKLYFTELKTIFYRVLTSINECAYLQSVHPAKVYISVEIANVYTYLQLIPLAKENQLNWKSASNKAFLANRHVKSLDLRRLLRLLLAEPARPSLASLLPDILPSEAGLP